MTPFSGDNPGKTQQPAPLVGPPRRERLTHRARRNAPAIVKQGRHDVDMKAAQLALFLEVGRRAGSRLAEVEVETDRGARNGEPVDQHLFDEGVSLQSRKRAI